MPLSWWRSHRDEIDMEPPYQRRGRLWSTSDKAFLVDSILNGYDVPKIYVADFTWGESSLNRSQLPYAIIDGKQRFEAIFDFFDDKLVLNPGFVFLPDPALKLGGLGYRDLKNQYAEVAEIFEVYPLSVMSVFSPDEDPINDLFVRLNRSKSLTGAEVRNAMGGPAPELFRRIADHDFFEENVRFEVKRGQDLNAAAKLLLFEFKNEMTETKKTTLDRFADQAKKMSGEERDLLELAGRQVVDVLSDLGSVFLPKDYLLSSAGLLPVYYWLVRSQEASELPRIREFIYRFEQQRQANRNLLKEEPDSSEIDTELVEYDNFNRSTNDLLSHKGRFGILRRRFESSTKRPKP